LPSGDQFWFVSSSSEAGKVIWFSPVPSGLIVNSAPFVWSSLK
jgi:hypothetical protein